MLTRTWFGRPRAAGLDFGAKHAHHSTGCLDCCHVCVCSLPQVWDIRRLERDVSFASRLTYAGQSGRITSVCPVLDGASVASASSSGSLHVWRVEYTSKPGGWAPDKYRGAVIKRLKGELSSRVLLVCWCRMPPHAATA